MPVRNKTYWERSVYRKPLSTDTKEKEGTASSLHVQKVDSGKEEEEEEEEEW